VADEIRNRLRGVAQEIQNAVRSSEDDLFRGWGQFVDAPAHSHQIGTYGTSAAILALLSSDANHPIDQRVLDQVENFWDEHTTNGAALRRLNIRLAFLVLCLANTGNTRLRVVCDNAIAELKNRQQQNGAWGDWHHPTEIAPPRSEITAWVALALARADENCPSAQAGAKYIFSELAGAPSSLRLSPIAVGAALTILPANRLSPELVFQARRLISEIGGGDQEYISFFDFVRQTPDRGQMGRDYLCFPSIYPLTLAIRGLYRRPFAHFRPGCIALRFGALSQLLELLSGGRTYRLRGARFAATVDQAMLYLACENLERCESRLDPLAKWLVPIGRWAKNAWTIRVVTPLAILACAMSTLEAPTALLELIEFFPRIELATAKQWVDLHESVVRLSAATILIVTSSLSASMHSFVRRKLFG
jgi:hypothetical protein